MYGKHNQGTLYFTAYDFHHVAYQQRRITEYPATFQEEEHQGPSYFMPNEMVSTVYTQIMQKRSCTKEIRGGV